MISYGSADPADLPAIADLFQQCFPEALSAVFGQPRIPPAPVEDVFGWLYELEPRGFVVARDAHRVIGGAVAVYSMKRLEQALWRRGLWRLLGRFFRGRYRGLGLAFIPRLIKAAWEYRDAPSAPAPEAATAQMLTAIVHEAYRGQGVGRELMERSLRYVQAAGARSVRLEVDAAKPAPIHLYQKLGFREVGRIPSPRGPALVMTRAL